MSGLIVELIIVCAFAIVAWIITERFAPDPLLEKLVKILIFVGVLVWVILKLVPRIM